MSDNKRKSAYDQTGSEVGVYTKRRAKEVADDGDIPVMLTSADQYPEGNPRTNLRAARNYELQASRAETPDEAGDMARRATQFRGEAIRNKFGRFGK